MLLFLNSLLDNIQDESFRHIPIIPNLIRFKIKKLFDQDVIGVIQGMRGVKGTFYLQQSVL